MEEPTPHPLLPLLVEVTVSPTNDLDITHTHTCTCAHTLFILLTGVTHILTWLCFQASLTSAPSSAAPANLSSFRVHVRGLLVRSAFSAASNAGLGISPKGTQTPAMRVSTHTQLAVLESDVPGSSLLCLYLKSQHMSCCFVIVQSLSRVQLCDPRDCSMPDFPVFHHLLEFAQVYVH